MGGGDEDAGAGGKGMIYDNIEDKDELVALDSRANIVKARWPIAPSGGATAMDMDVQHRLLFIGGRDKVGAILYADTRQIVQKLFHREGADTTIFLTEKRLFFITPPPRTLHTFHL